MFSWFYIPKNVLIDSEFKAYKYTVQKISKHRSTLRPTAADDTSLLSQPKAVGELVDLGESDGQRAYHVLRSQS